MYSHMRVRVFETLSDADKKSVLLDTFFYLAFIF
jgi:hypothetical protein